MRALCYGTDQCEQCGQPIVAGERRTCLKFVPSTEGAPIATQPTGLGDWTEQMLSSIGVTKERYISAKEKFGLAPTCDCDARKEWLNKVSDWWRSTPPTQPPE